METPSQLKKCPYCAETILVEAKKCRYCGEILDSALQSERKLEKEWNHGTAAVLSLVIPGAGQIYKGQLVAGLLWLAFIALGYYMYILPGIVIHLFCVIFAASGKSTKSNALKETIIEILGIGGSVLLLPGMIMLLARGIYYDPRGWAFLFIGAGLIFISLTLRYRSKQIAAEQGQGQPDIAKKRRWKSLHY